MTMASRLGRTLGVFAVAGGCAMGVGLRAQAASELSNFEKERLEIEMSSKPYAFLAGSTQYVTIAKQAYRFGRNKEDRINLVFSCPSNGAIEFSNQARITLASGVKHRAVALAAGIYPFILSDTGTNEVKLCGAMAIYNIDNTIALATLGKTDKTKLFNADLVGKAQAGKLATYTITFDNKEVLTYWLGNRASLYAGGPATVEIDLSGTPGITKLEVNDEDVPSFKKDLLVIKKKFFGLIKRPCEYSFKMTCGDKDFVGYIRNLKANDFTAFVSIPCVIPQELLNVAAEGTVSRFTVHSQGDKKEAVAEIVLSGR